MLFRRQNCNIKLFCYINLSETPPAMNPIFYEYWLVVKELIFSGARITQMV